MAANFTDAELVKVFVSIDREMKNDPKVKNPKPLMLYASMMPYYLRKYRELRDVGKL
jgi:hypothetical protein